jgi:hypothetical protein
MLVLRAQPFGTGPSPALSPIEVTGLPIPDTCGVDQGLQASGSGLGPQAHTPDEEEWDLEALATFFGHADE